MPSTQADTTFKGSLAQTSVPDLCQVLSRRIGALNIEGTQVNGRIFFKEGVLVHAECEPFFGRDAFFELANQAQGLFHFESDAAPSYVSLSDKPDRLLMTAAVYGDMLNDLKTVLVHDNTVLEWLTYDPDRSDLIFTNQAKIEVWNRLEQPNTLYGITLEMMKAGFSRMEIIEAVHSLVTEKIIAPSATPAVAKQLITRPLPSLMAGALAKPASAPKSPLLLTITIAAAVVVIGAAAAIFLFKSKDQPGPSRTLVLEKPAPAPAIAVSSRPALPENGSVEALDTDALKTILGKPAQIKGKVLRIKTDAKSGITFLDFRTKPKQGFVAIIYPDDLKKFESPEIYLEKQVRLTGSLTEYQGLPQLVLADPKQISFD